VLIAFALMAIVAAVTLRVITGGAADEARRLQSVALLEFARSKAEEYATTYPIAAATGVEPGGWAWSVSEERVKPDGPSRFDADIALFALTIAVWREDRSDDREVAHTIVARRP
jgi:type II secretory pathway pseudopilin PulG